MGGQRFDEQERVTMKATGTWGCRGALAVLATCALACGSSGSGNENAGSTSDASTDGAAVVASDATSGTEGEAAAATEEASTEAGGGDAAAAVVDGGEDAQQESGSEGSTGDSSACPSSQLDCGGVCVPNDTVNCGTCGHDCTNLHVTSAVACVAGACSFPSLTCAAGWANCSGDAGDGCESALTGPDHCGSCDNACGTSPVCAPSGSSYACLKVVALAASSDATFAVFSNAIVQSWGANSGEALDNDGVLGTGSNASSTPVPAPISSLTTVTAVAGGDDHACALLSSGTVECWGDNSYGQLGTSADPTTGLANTLTPVAVAGLTNVTALAAGLSHTCALRSDGTVECWGSNDNGELGTSLSTSCNGFDKCSPTPTAVPGLSSVLAIAIGGDSSTYGDHTCALISGGTVKCWGYNGDGELGNGDLPVAAPWFDATPGTVSGITTAIGITASNGSSCALLSGGSVQCWGDNSVGQLGNGSMTGTATPTDVSGLSDAVSLSVGSAAWSICAVRTSGAAKCWGEGYNGGLGDGVGEDQSSVPVPVVNLTNITAIAAGASHLCALLSTGNVDCWGFDGAGQVGNAGADPNVNPTPLPVQW
jgi:alpha-tubulin suppressor-like RCC1 family protein